jgi:hypothetical protein
MPPLMTLCGALHTARAMSMLGLHEVDEQSLYTTDFSPRKDAKYILTLVVTLLASGLWTFPDVTLRGADDRLLQVPLTGTHEFSLTWEASGGSDKVAPPVRVVRAAQELGHASL